MYSSCFTANHHLNKEQDSFALASEYSQLLSSQRICSHWLLPLRCQACWCLSLGSFQLCANPSKLTHSLCSSLPSLSEVSLLSLWLSQFRLSQFFQPQSTCTSHHIIFCTKFNCSIPFQGSHWLSQIRSHLPVKKQWDCIMPWPVVAFSSSTFITHINLLEHTELFKSSRNFANINAINLWTLTAKDDVLSLANNDLSEEVLIFESTKWQDCGVKVYVKQIRTSQRSNVQEKMLLPVKNCIPTHQNLLLTAPPSSGGPSSKIEQVFSAWEGEWTLLQRLCQIFI